MDRNDCIEKLRATLSANEKVQLALLFGSYAQGKQGPSSDIDVGIAYKNVMSLDEIVDISQALSKVTKREVDVVDLRKAQGVLLQQILSHRVTLLRRDEELLGNLMSKRIVEESDLMPLLDMILKRRRERFINGKKSH